MGRGGGCSKGRLWKEAQCVVVCGGGGCAVGGGNGRNGLAQRVSACCKVYALQIPPMMELTVWEALGRSGRRVILRGGVDTSCGRGEGEEKIGWWVERGGYPGSSPIRSY